MREHAVFRGAARMLMHGGSVVPTFFVYRRDKKNELLTGFRRA